MARLDVTVNLAGRWADFKGVTVDTSVGVKQLTVVVHRSHGQPEHRGRCPYKLPEPWAA
jgi:hypothetical protein